MWYVGLCDIEFEILVEVCVDCDVGECDCVVCEKWLFG